MCTIRSFGLLLHIIRNMKRCFDLGLIDNDNISNNPHEKTLNRLKNNPEYLIDHNFKMYFKIS